MDDERAEYRIMGFPSLLTGEGGRYSRNEYMWNLCFVFHGSSSLEAFEPVVRKCGRILKSAELDSSYLSSPEPYHTPLSAVLEQLFEDLNSYSETSIPLDGFNSLELKLFPYFPNPPDCSDWHVPIPLVNLDAFRDDNWDITASRVAEHIDGVNHVKRIAELADADIALTRETLRHMLFYQVVMMIDIFQYSNMYTLKPSIARLGSDESVTSECAAYVTRPGYSRQPWPTLLRLYSHLVPGLTIHEWIEKYHTQALGIDPRRFVSFGIIKGFLRRVHRWPVLMEKSTLLSGDGEPRRRVEFDKVPRIESSLSTRSTKLDATARSGGESTFTLRSMESNQSLGVSPSRTPSTLTKSPSRRGHQPNFTNVKDSFPSVHSAGEASIPSKKSGGVMKTGAMKLKERQDKLMEEDLIGMLDGSHHTDEIQVRFGLSWKELDKVIRGSDRGAKDGVVVVYR
ncbi:nitrogen permease regulator 2-domain-containing protein [Kockovaella imperatae]|uniref:Nitrogen permease regulator 2-domain-containing protein n=1 Tax=Kockovaella imperatae TaxID=4999 RepID=A0A1Y1UC21_9TREE|nr:nitrogen permease regulator 2-domain-containing protein [Kockovaella imperatae]ORX35598.1 nitrogen permease regulator 2-domain-containing protein [Kockovaella imperatae]